MKRQSRKQQRNKKKERHTEEPINHDDNKLASKEQLNKMSSPHQIQLIKDIVERIVVEPEANIKQTATILTLMKSDNIQTVVNAIDGLATIFTSIGPVSQPEEDKNSRLKKVEYQLRTFEKSVLDCYGRYVQLLKQLVAKLKKQLFSNNEKLYLQFRRVVIDGACRCIQSLWSCSLTKPLIGLICRNLKNDTVQNLLKDMLSDHNNETLNIKLQIIKIIAQKLVKKPEASLPPNLLAVINSIHIDSSHLDKDEQGKKYKDKKQKKKMYKQKEQQKKKDKEKDPLQLYREKKAMKKAQRDQVRQDVNKQFAQGELHVDHKRITRLNSQILQQLFYIYFKILLRRTHSIYLKDALDGMLKFAHLINTQLIKSLIQNLNSSAEHLRKQWQSNKKVNNIEAGLQVVFTAESIINGPASVFSMADHKESIAFFRILKDINRIDSKEKLPIEIYRLVLMVVDQMLFKKRQLSIEVVACIALQITIMCSRKEAPRLAILKVLSLIANRYSRILRMFEEDNEGFGINCYNPAVEDPHVSNSINTSLIGHLSQLKKMGLKDQEKQQVDRLLKRNFSSQQIYDVQSLLKTMS